MTNAIKNWLPVTKRNLVALGFAFAALVMFVVWNLLPYYDYESSGTGVTFVSNGPVLLYIWPEMVDADNYLRVIRSPDVDGFLSVAASLALLFKGLMVLVLVPLWQMLHASNYLRVPVAILNLLGGLVVMKFLVEDIMRDSGSMYDDAPYQNLTLLLIALTMFAVGAAMVIFKNELLLRHEREVGKTLNSKL